jgi:hypothetical protein
MGKMRSTIWTLIKRPAHWYLQNRPRTWAIAYLVAIPAFGFYYLLVIPDSFYAPYAQYDPDLTADGVALTKTMQAAVARAYDQAFDAAVEKKYPGGIPSGGSLSLPSKDHLVVEASKEGSQLVFIINWLGPSPFFRGSVRHLWPFVTLTIKKIEPIPQGGQAVQIKVDQTPYGTERSDVLQTGENFYDAMFKRTGGDVLALTPDEAATIRKYLLGVQGRTDSFSNNVVRMMYLSAVVQTTLGLGDLIPMTTAARIAVALQAIFGIVFAGLFLNAAGRGAQNK